MAGETPGPPLCFASFAGRWLSPEEPPLLLLRPQTPEAPDALLHPPSLNSLDLSLIATETLLLLTL